MQKGKHLLLASLVALVVLATSVRAGINRWTPIGPEGGDIRFLLVDPTHPEIIYAGTDAGVLKSTDAGAHWVLITKPLPLFPNYGPVSPSVKTLVLDPMNSGTVYVSYYPAGLYKTTDGGNTWVTTNNGLPQPFYVVDLAVDPAEPSVVYAGTGQSGIFKSTDGGGNWVAASSGLPVQGSGSSVRYPYPNVIAIDPSNRQTVYLGMGGGGVSQGVFRSSDGGTSWQRAGVGLDQENVVSIAFHPKNPEIILAGTWGSGLYASTNGGNLWSVRSTPQGVLYQIELDPEDPDLLYAALSDGEGLRKSTDSGFTWELVEGGLPAAIGSFALNPKQRSTMYAGTDIWDPHGKTDGETGVYRSTDSGKTWARTSAGLHAWPTSSLVCLPHEPAGLVAGGEARLHRTTSGGANWSSTLLQASDFTSLAVDPQNPSIVYAGTRAFGGIFKSTNAGVNWVQAVNGLPGEEGNWASVYSLAIDPKHPETIYAGTYGYGISKSTDGGGHWITLSLSAPKTYVAGVAVDPGDSSTIYGALYSTSSSGRNGIARSTDGGLTWSDQNAGLPSTRPAFSLTVSPDEPGTVYAGIYAAGVFKSTDAGLFWKPASSGLPSMPVGAQTFYLSVRSVLVHPTDSSVLYAGIVGGGVFRSTDAGNSWQDYSTGLEQLLVTGLAISPSDPATLYAATEGGGVWAITQTDPLILLFPYYRNSSDCFTGFAVSNYGDKVAHFDFESFQASGLRMSCPWNPNANTLAPHRQLARLGPELLGSALDETHTGWVRLASDQPLGSFFQAGGSEGLDGAVAWTTPAKQLFFTRVFQGKGAFRGQDATTWLSIANPGPQESSLTFRFRGRHNGQDVQLEATRKIPANGSLWESIPEIFGSGSDTKNGGITVEVTQGEGIVGFELIECGSSRALIGLNAAVASTDLRFYSAQFAHWGGLFTNLRLWNTAGQPRTAVLTLVGDDGSVLGSPVQLTLAANELYEKDADQIFSVTEGQTLIGTLRVEADGAGVTGDVIFADSASAAYAAALPLQSRTFTRAVFSQVANLTSFFTGIALHNPGTEGATAIVRVFSDAGAKTGETEIQIGPGVRLAKLLPELMPSTAGQVRGYVEVESTGGLIGQQLFGSATVLSAVPPTIVK